MKDTNNFILTPPAQYKGKQIIITSDRVLLNAKTDSILLFSKQAIGFSSAGSINFDCDNKVIINAPKIYLGLDAKEPLLLGNKTTNLLKELLTKLRIVAEALSRLTARIGDVQYPMTEINTPGQDLSFTIEQILSQIDEIKSKQNFTQ